MNTLHTFSQADSQAEISTNCRELHKAVILFNHSSEQNDKDTLKQFIEKRICTLEVNWELVPAS